MRPLGTSRSNAATISTPALAKPRARLFPAVYVGVWEALLDEFYVVGMVDGQAAIGQSNRTILEENLVNSGALDALVDVEQ